MNIKTWFYAESPREELISHIPVVGMDGIPEAWMPSEYLPAGKPDKNQQELFNALEASNYFPTLRKTACIDTGSIR